MAARKPPPSTLAAEQQRKLRAFHERASAFVLDHPVLDAELWGQLTVLADELGLHHHLLRETIVDWKRRGVITRIEVSIPKPPPLPKSPPAADQPMARPTGKLAAKPQPQPTPPAPPPPEPRFARERFLEQAVAIVAEHRGMGPQAQARLMQVARDLGMSDDEAAESIKSLHRGESTPPSGPPTRATGAAGKAAKSPPPTAAGAAGTPRGAPEPPAIDTQPRRRRWLEDEPNAEPNSAAKTPADKPPADKTPENKTPENKTPDGQPPESKPPEKKWPDVEFRTAAAAALDKFGKKGVSHDLEDGLINQGYKTHKLSRVYARDIVQEVAAAKGLQVASLADDAATAADEEPTDPKLQEFLDRAGSILAQHRGLNAKSRVLLVAVAREVGLDDDELQTGIRLLESQRPAPNALDPVQQRRLEPFLKPLRDRLSSLPHGILNVAVQEGLLEQGEHRFGLTAETTRNAIRELVAELKLQVISEAEAMRHLEGLVEEAMGENLRLPTDVMARLVAEGARWGLSSERVEEIVRQRSTENYRRKRSAQKFSSMALIGANIAILVVVGFIGWAIFGGRLTSPVIEPEEATVATTKTTTGETAAQPADERFDSSWWNTYMIIAARNARLELKLPTRSINDVAALDVERRSAAYRQLADHALAPTASDLERDIIEELLAHAYAQEPSDEAADALRSALLDPVPGPEDRLSENPEDYPRLFQAMRIAVAALKASDKVEARAEQMARAIGDVVGARITVEQSEKELQQQCLGALAERLFRLLIASAGTQPAVVAPLHPIVLEEAKRYLNEATLDALNADFLLALLSSAEDQWQAFQTLIADTIQATDPLTVVKLVDLYESTDSDALRDYMGPLLLDRAERGTVDRTPEELAAEVRSALGVSRQPTLEGRWRRLKLLANKELGGVEATADQPGPLLQEAVRLSYFATLGAALEQREMGFAAYDELEKAGPPDLSVDESGSPRRRRGPRDADWSAMSAVDRDLEMMLRQGAAGRAARVESLGRLAERLPDLRADQAQLLAGYLLTASSENEHRIAMEHVPALARWTQLRLAIADGIQRARISREQLRTLLSRLMGEDVSLDLIEQGAEAVRAALLRDILNDLGETETSSDLDDPVIYDQARQMVLRHYAKRAELAGVSPAAIGEPPTPATILRAMIQHQVAALEGRGLKDDARRLVRDVPHQLVAIDYAADDDLQQTVMLQRLWIDLLAIGARLDKPAAAPVIDGLLAELHRADRSATSSLAQLRDGEATIVRLQLAAHEG